MCMQCHEFPGITNQLVDIEFDFTSTFAVKCKFLHLTRNSVNRCRLMYGLETQSSCSNYSFINEGNPTTAQNIIINLKNVSNTSWNRSCYSLTASNGTSTVKVTGSFKRGIHNAIK